MIHYSDDAAAADALTISGFCPGWKQPLDESAIRRLLRSSQHRAIAWDDQTRRMLGLATALSDGVNWAFIPWLEVLPEWQGQGIGSALLRRLLDQLRDITCVDLTCDEAVQPFYERFGMLRSHGMVIRRYLD